MSSHIGLVGLGVMGSNIALNLADHDYRVAVYTHTTQKIDAFVSNAETHQQFVGCHDYAALCAELETPRVVLLMVTAGEVVDRVVEQLLPHLEPGDVIVDGGNSNYMDTQRRYERLRADGYRFLGMGISGGEEGARHGPSMMPGGDPEAWPLVEDMFRAVAAKADDGEPCCRWVGEGGAGHYVKMVHNGIEYGDMQLIAEAWQLLSAGMAIDMEQVADIFADWNSGVLSSYLVEITADILRVKDPDGTPRVNNILDSAGQKGTGRWTAIDSLQLGVPLTMIAEAVYARALSALKHERIVASGRLGGMRSSFEGDREHAIDAIHDALYAAKIISYAQGFMQMREAAQAYGWQLEFGNIALLWRAGCIIRSRFLNDIKTAFDKTPGLSSLLLDQFFADAVRQAEPGWRNTVVNAVNLGIAVPAMSSALSFYDGYRSAVLPANLLQAQRDYFGAHTYRRVDREGVFHTHWSTDGSEDSVDG